MYNLHMQETLGVILGISFFSSELLSWLLLFLVAPAGFGAFVIYGIFFLGYKKGNPERAAELLKSSKKASLLAVYALTGSLLLFGYVQLIENSDFLYDLMPRMIN